jgi:hypothetical protein
MWDKWPLSWVWQAIELLIIMATMVVGAVLMLLFLAVRVAAFFAALVGAFMLIAAIATGTAWSNHHTAASWAAFVHAAIGAGLAFGFVILSIWLPLLFINASATPPTNPVRRAPR